MSEVEPSADMAEQRLVASSQLRGWK